VTPSLADGQMTNESQAITDAVAKSGDRQHSIIDAQFPIMPFCAKPFPNDFSCSPLSSKCSISVATRGPSILQEENQAPQTHGEGEHLGALRHHMYYRHKQFSDLCPRVPFATIFTTGPRHQRRKNDHGSAPMQFLLRQIFSAPRSPQAQQR
jgi:hypothetical protein